MNDKLIAAIREWDDRYCEGELPFECREKLYEILSRHEAEQGEGLRRKLVDILTGENCPCWRRDCKNCVTDNCSFVSENIDKIMQLSIPTPDKAVEPLAVLADRKGVPRIRTAKCDPYGWYISIRTEKAKCRKVFTADDYSAAEAKAKAYLTSLPDKK